MSDVAKVIERKFAHMQTSFQREGMVASLRKADSGARDNVLALVGRKLESLSAQWSATKVPAEQEQIRAQMTAWNHWKVQFEAKGLESTDSDATKDFFAWLLGKGKEDHHRQTPWYRDQALLELPDVQKWVDGFADIWTESVDELKKLAWKTPQNLDEAWLYFKFIVQTDWMKREDRFFWVDLVNLMNEKAKLGGGLLREEFQTAQPYIRTTEGGETGILPLSENDVFDASIAGTGRGPIRGELTKAQIAEVKATLGRQLEHWSTINDITKDARRNIKLKAPKKSEIETYVAAVQMDEADLEAKLKSLDWEVAKRGAEESVFSLAGLWNAVAKVSNMAFAEEETGAPFTTEFSIIQNSVLRGLHDSIKKASASGEKEEEIIGFASKTLVPAKPERIKETLGHVKDAQNALIALVGSGVTEDDKLRFTKIFDGLQFTRYNLEFRLEGEKAALAGANGAEINAQAAIAMMLKPPDVRDLVDGVNKAVSKALQDAPGLAGKTMSTQEKGQLQATARMAKVMGDFLEARSEIYRSYTPRGEAEASFVEMVLEERWRMWLSAAGVSGELALSMGTAPRNPIQMAQMYETMLNSIRERSDLLWKYIISDEGGTLRRAYAFQNVPFLNEQVARFERKFEKHGLELSPTAKALFMDPHDHAQINMMAKMWKGMYDRSDWDRNWQSVWLYFEKVGIAVKSGGVKFAKSAGAFAVGQAGTWMLRVAVPHDGAMRWGATAVIHLAAKLAFGAMGTPTAATLFTNFAWSAAGQAMTSATSTMHEGPVKLATWLISNTVNTQREAQKEVSMAEFAANWGATFDTFASWLPTMFVGGTLLTGGLLAAPGAALGLGGLGLQQGLAAVLWGGGAMAGKAAAVGVTGYLYHHFFGGGAGLGASLTEAVGSAIASFALPRTVVDLNLPVHIRELFDDPAKLKAFLTRNVVHTLPKAPEDVVYIESKGKIAMDRWNRLNPETGHWEMVRGDTMKMFGKETVEFPSALDPKFKPLFDATSSPFVQTMLSGLSSTWFKEADRLHQAMKMASGLNLTAFDLFDASIPWQAKTGIFARMAWEMGGPFWSALQSSRVELLQSISQLNKLDVRDVYMDYASQKARQRLESRQRDLRGARRLKEHKPKKKMQAKVRAATDARTGEGLVKKVGATRVQVQ